MKVLAVQGSPRRGGNTEILLDEAIRGVKDEGGEVKKVVLIDLRIEPCLEDYACKKAGECFIQDDMTGLYGALDEVNRVILASPIFFYNLPAHTKAFVDRCQAHWVRRYVLEKRMESLIERKGAFMAVGATKGKRLFDGVQLTVRYFFDAIDMAYSESLLVRGVDEKAEILQRPDLLQKAQALGRKIALP